MHRYPAAVATCLLALCLPAAEPAVLPAPVPTAPAVDGSWRDSIRTVDNGIVRIAADPVHGGRLIEYSVGGINALHTEPGHPEWVYPDNNHWTGPDAGRFDIGPEETLPEHLALWDGPWAIERSGDLSLRLTSRPDQGTGVQLVRDFALEVGTTRLRCTQTIRNITDRPLHRAYWGRSIVPGGGILVTRITPGSRFPMGWIACVGWPDFTIRTRPKDPAVAMQGDLMVVRGAPLTKIGLDTESGWIGYLMPSNKLFLKRFPVFRERRYADIPGLTIGIWTDKGRFFEVEPMGPEELIAPGASASFTEEWWLLDYPFPAADAAFDAAALAAFAQRTLSAP